MICKHSIIQTFRTEDGEPVMWACSECRHKFVPFEQMLQEVADEREACAQLCDRMRPTYRAYDHRYFDAATDCAAAIRARGQE